MVIDGKYKYYLLSALFFQGTERNLCLGLQRCREKIRNMRVAWNIKPVRSGIIDVENIGSACT